ncbi:stress responsive A/B barrel domain-containing protein [Cadophora sp. MPI-SDFR-AT-0126]|nr:stress responsive A/B barrel domain-containing protein [Leotiomycetes sp. MPI-SDFR-AT-0126]
MSSTKPIQRITLFKIPNISDQEKLLDIYKGMKQNALKDGKPYILSVTAGHGIPSQRDQGYTVAVVSVFASVQDMVYYDEECEAHKKLKAFAKSVNQGAMMVYFESVTS